MKEQFNQSEKIWPAKDATSKDELIKKKKEEGFPDWMIERDEETANYLKQLEEVAKNSGIIEIQSGLKEYFPSTYHPFSPDGPDRPKHLTEEEIKQFAFALADASINSIKESNWTVLQLSGGDMDLKEYEISTSKLEELINKRFEEKGITNKKIARIHNYPLYRQTTGKRPGPSEPGFLLIETVEKDQTEK